MIDVQKILFGAEASPFNWQEAIIETILIAGVGYFTISRLFPEKSLLSEKESLKGSRYIWIPVLISFLGLFAIIWLNEIIDLPYLIMRGEKTPANWPEAAFESFIVICIGIITFSILFRNIMERTRAQDLFFKSFYFSPIPSTITSVSQGTSRPTLSETGRSPMPR